LTLSDNHANGNRQNGTATSKAPALQLYAALLDDIRGKALDVVQWAEDSMREFEAITARWEGGRDAD